MFESEVLEINELIISNVTLLKGSYFLASQTNNIIFKNSIFKDFTI
jgi:hypothetical protein